MRVHILCIILVGYSGLISSGILWAADRGGVLVQRPALSTALPLASNGGTGETLDSGVVHTEFLALMRIRAVFDLERFEQIALNIRSFERTYLGGEALPSDIQLRRTVEAVAPADYPHSFNPEGRSVDDAIAATRKRDMYEACAIFRPRGFMGILGTAFRAGGEVWRSFADLMKSKRLSLTCPRYKERVVDIGWLYEYFGSGYKEHVWIHFYPRLRKGLLGIWEYFPSTVCRKVPVHPAIYYFSILDEIIGKLNSYDDAELNQKCDAGNNITTINSPVLQRVIDDFIAPYMVFDGHDRSRFHMMWADIIANITRCGSWKSTDARSPVPLASIINFSCFWLTMTAYTFRQICPSHEAAADKILLLTRYIARHAARQKSIQQKSIVAALIRGCQPADLFGVADGGVQARVDVMTPAYLSTRGVPTWWPSRLI